MQVQNNVIKIYETLVRFEGRVDSNDKIIQMMELFLENCLASGANLSQMMDGIQGDTILHKAVRAEKVCVVTALIRKGADPDAANLAERTPRQMAERCQELSRLFPVKAKPPAPAFEITTSKPTPESYFKAVRGGNLEAANFLIQQGGRTLLLARDEHYRTALHMAAYAGHEAVVKRLLELGVEMDAKDEDGRTALFLASQAGHVGTVKLLLQEGGARNETDNSKKTPLHLAAFHGHLEVATILAVSRDGENISESIRLRDRDGKRPMDIAAANVIPFLKFLEELERQTK